MKKVLVVLLSFVLALSFVACKKNPTTESPGNNGDLEVVDTDGPDKDGQAGSDQSPGNSNQDPLSSLAEQIALLPDEEALDQIWNRLDGYWTTDDYFFGFISTGAIKFVSFGIYHSEGLGYAELIEASASGSEQFTMIVRFPAMPATETMEARAEKDATVIIDTSAFGSDGIISIRIDGYYEGTLQYIYGGETFEDAYDASH